MAESSSDKTEQPTPKKLRDARKKGQVAQSKDIAPALILLFGALYFWVAGPWLFQSLLDIFIIIPELQNRPFMQAVTSSLDIVINTVVAVILLPFIMLMAITGALSFILQFGFIFVFDPVIPKLEKISFGSGFKRLFSAKQFVTTVMSLIKTIVIAIALAFVIYWGLSELLNEIEQCNVICQLTVVTDMFMTLMMLVLPLMIVMAVIDLIFQKSQFEKDQKMTKEEVKREMKDMYGDPHIKGAREGVRREMSEQDVRTRIKTARLVVIDIGIAVALHYEQDVTPLPLIVAIGKAGMARTMVEIAQIEDVPIVSDARLVADLVEEGKLDQYIPTTTIDRVAQAMRQTSG